LTLDLAPLGRGARALADPPIWPEKRNRSIERPIFSGNGTSEPDVVIATEEDCHAVVLFASHHIRGGVRDAATGRACDEEKQGH
jgi:hypothetical protein